MDSFCVPSFRSSNLLNLCVEQRQHEELKEIQQLVGAQKMQYAHMASEMRAIQEERTREQAQLTSLQALVKVGLSDESCE